MSRSAVTLAASKSANSYRHKEAESLMRPEVGTQPQFRKKKPAAKFRFDDSLSPMLQWDSQNPARERGEELIAEVLRAETLDAARAAASKLKSMSKPFLNWAGKAERTSFEVPTLPLFIHERLSTKAILETLKGHRRDRQTDMFELFGDPQHSITDQVLRAYEHRDRWVNRMILGDSMVVMNSLLHYEGLGGQVQMIYIDPPYGVKFGSNFQPFVRRRDVSHSDDEDMTREPEMVQAYRDTWELGLHSYLSYLRDRMLLARELLAPTGSIFVQISDENQHRVRELMDEVFGTENFCSIITVRKTTSEGSNLLGSTSDFLLWYGKSRDRTKFHPIFVQRSDEAESRYDQLMFSDGTTRAATEEEQSGKTVLPAGAKVFRVDNITSSRPAGEGDLKEFNYQGRVFKPGTGTFKTDQTGMERLAAAERLQVTSKGKLNYRRFKDDFCQARIGNLWSDISGAVQSRSDPKIYVVQTSTTIIQRCLLMTTEPGDLVLDPTCGSGTTACVAEHWGRRWITIDTSRVPLALARQRLLTATFDWYELKNDNRGPAGGFVYKRKRNRKGEEVGGIVPHITLKSIANNEPPEEEVLVDRPEIAKGITRVTGAFCVEGTIPVPMDGFGQGQTQSPLTPVSHSGENARDPSSAQVDSQGSYVQRMLEVLRRAPVLRMANNKTITLKNVRPPAKSLSLSGEAVIPNGNDKSAALVFGPENGAISERLVFDAAKEATAKNYSHLFVIGFKIEPNARLLIEKCGDIVGVPATYVEATMDLQMGDLLKNLRSSQIFSVCGLPDIVLRKAESSTSGEQLYAVELLGIDVFDPMSMEVAHKHGDDVPAWFLDTNYNGLSFHVDQAFFPRTGAWENLRKALKGEYEDSVWEHLAGAKSTPFAIGDHGQIAVKVIDDRGNELMAIKNASECMREPKKQPQGVVAVAAAGRGAVSKTNGGKWRASRR